MSRPTTILDAFKKWLVACGAVVEPATNEWEILRVRTVDGVQIAYRDKKGHETWSESLCRYRTAYCEGKAIALSPDLTKRRALSQFISPIALRDGLECFFCGCTFTSTNDDRITVEHLLSRAHGGKNHPSNLALACQPCNQEAGVLSVVEKVKLRERKRQS